MTNLIQRYQDSFRENAALPAVTQYADGKTYSYLQLAAKIKENHSLFRSLGLEKGDKVALIGKNGVQWITTYISVITYGAVIVPILPDFDPIDAANIIGHSDAKLLYGDRSLLARMDTTSITGLLRTMELESVEDPVTDGFDPSAITYDIPDWEDLMVISYTSGTTGNSKGVMIPCRALSSNVDFTLDHGFHFRESHVLGLLPLAHAYGCCFDMLAPLTIGSHIFVLGKTPTPKILLQALKDVRPHLLCTVPLVMEKIVRKTVMPQLEKEPVKTLIKLPLVNDIIYSKIRKKILDAFGGRIMEINMGGAALAPDVEKLLRLIRFPFMVGYGMTETAPLMSYSGWREFKPGSCGQIFPGLDLRIEENGSAPGQGEICVRGVNVMLGYYKNPEATAAALQDGWLHTGDIGYADKDGTLYLKGRCKTMILTSAGQNIYPEEIEAKLNNLGGVLESLVYEKDGKIYALVVPDGDWAKQNSVSDEGMREKMKENLLVLNSLVAPYEKVAEIKLCSEPFEKTPKQSIKRYLYPDGAKLM